MVALPVMLVEKVVWPRTIMRPTKSKSPLIVRSPSTTMIPHPLALPFIWTLFAVGRVLWGLAGVPRAWRGVVLLGWSPAGFGGVPPAAGVRGLLSFGRGRVGPPRLRPPHGGAGR